MTDKNLSLGRGPLSLAESEILRALEKLPSGFSVTSGERLPLTDDDRRFAYESDFVVSSPDARRLYIEVKSARALSLANLSRFIAIEHRIRELGGRFLLLVLGQYDLDSSSSLRRLSEFKKLHIQSVRDDDEVVRAVTTEFRDLEPWL